MKQTLSLKLGQRLAMTPELHQAIQLMRLSALELKAEVRNIVESNPMLTLDEDEGEEDGRDELEPGELQDGEFAETEGEAASEFDGETAPADDGSEADETIEAIPEDLPVDVSWDEVYQPSAGSTMTTARDDDDTAFEERNSVAETLRDHLLWQLNLTRFSERDRQAALAIIESIDDDGMLHAAADDLLAALPAELRYGVDELQAVLKRVQRFDPPGVGARSVEECLLLQLEQLAEQTPWRKQAMELLTHHAALLVKGDPAALARRCKIGTDELEHVMTLLQSLNPRPGAAIGDSDVAHVEPDVTVARKDGRWVVELNQEAAPPVRVRSDYAGLVNRVAKDADNQYLKDNLHDAKWFLKCLQYRNETLLRVAAEIVERQRGFLEHGEEAMQPLVLSDIAEAVERHESTVSRVTTRKYMATPRGIFELKFFFSSHVAAANGVEVSSTAIRALVKKLIAEEDRQKPLSDLKITALLKERGIDVARRTVAKYRESLAIPASNERKRLL